jgi:hypothetical protein
MYLDHHISQVLTQCLLSADVSATLPSNPREVQV